MADVNYKNLYEEEKKKTEALQKKWDSLELQGKAKLYYSLNRNMSDLSDMLDNTDLTKVNMDDPKDKTMERLKMIWASVKPLVETLSMIGLSSGITEDEVADTARKPFVDTIPEHRK